MKVFECMKGLCLTILLLLVQGISAQNAKELLIDHTFISNTGYVCEETAEPDPCAGLQVYLILEFSKNKVVIIEKQVSSCEAEYVTFQKSYVWSVKNKRDIVIDVDAKEIEYAFINGLTLKIENGKLVGYKQLVSENPRVFNFEESPKKE